MERTGWKLTKGGALQIRDFEREVMNTMGRGKPSVLEQARMLAIELSFVAHRAGLLGYSLEELASLATEKKN